MNFVTSSKSTKRNVQQLETELITSLSADDIDANGLAGVAVNKRIEDRLDDNDANGLTPPIEMFLNI
eukprot:Awhi_evm1s14724